MKGTIFFLACLLIVFPCQAGTITVDDNGPADFNNIQDAINAAGTGDIIVVRPGTYTGERNRNIDFLGKAITVRGTDPNDFNIVAKTIIDCQENGRGFYFHSEEGAASIVDGLTITNGYASSGGGIRCDGARPTIVRCVISDNFTTGDGGGLFNCDGRISDCVIKGNRTASKHYGGGLAHCDGEIKRCVVTGNTATWYGGGFASCHGRTANCVITHNTCGYWGGGLYDCDGIITNCTVAYNTNNYSSHYSGGLSKCNGSITNCIAWYNIPSKYQISGGSTPSYSCWPGGSGTGNVDTDPLFVDAASGDYRVLPWSPCIDAGTNTPVGGLPTTDIDGNIRPLDGDNNGFAVADMGAYESPLCEDPVIEISTEEIKFRVFEGSSNPEDQIFNVRNRGAGVLSWEIIYNCEWLEVNPGSGNTTGVPDDITLEIDANGVDRGNYTCILTVWSDEALNNPKTVEVNLVVNGIINVPGDFPTIKTAVNAANTGDIVVIAAGTYTGSDNKNISFGGKTITVRSENGPETCIIDCRGSGRGFSFTHGEDANSIVEGFTIKNGEAYYGAGIYCTSSSPTVNNCIITKNSSPHRKGGGIYCENSNLRITNSIISKNYTGDNGGGIFCDDYSNVTVSNCMIIGNKASRDGGGLEFWYHSKPNVTNCVIAGNKAGRHGGGIDCFIDSPPTLTNCTIVGNEGGGLHDCYGPITNCIIWNNSPYDLSSSSVPTYSCYPGASIGMGNIDADPCFVEPGYWDANGVWVEGDYHLQSAGWRWDSRRQRCDYVEATSRCIDAGMDAGVYTDIEGNVRPFDYPNVDNNGDLPEFDIGAYEAVLLPIEVLMKFTPQALNPGSQGNWVKAHFVLPEGFSVEDVDADSPAKITEPFEPDIESDHISVFVNDEGLVEIEATFDRVQFCQAGIEGESIEVTVTGSLASGQGFYGTETVKITKSALKYLASLGSAWLEAGCARPEWCGGADLDQDGSVDFADFALFDGCCIEIITE